MDGRKTGWMVDGDHVYPVHDLRAHVPINCWCHPKEDEGVVVHNSLDRRELYEQGILKLS
jgi:hypothetical protein